MCKRLIPPLIAVVVLAAGAARANLVAYWAMNKGAGTTVADASGNTHNGAIQGKPTWVDGPEGVVMESPYASDPIPADGAEGLLPSGLLSWQPGSGAQKHHLYLGTDESAVTARAASTDKGLMTTASFYAGILRSATSYYWLVDEVPISGPAKQGMLWSFTTENRATAVKVLREWWTGIPGTAVADLLNDPRFPDHPTGSALLNEFEGPANWADNYGSRLRGWLSPPQSGPYRFWIASGGASELWLSKDAEPANAVKIARVLGGTDVQEWTKEPGQTSAPITLQQGGTYYIQVLMKQGNGGDHVSVAWQPPGDIQQVIPGSCVNTFALPPLQTWGPSPRNGTVGVRRNQATLNWSAGIGGADDIVYFGPDKAAVMAANASTPEICQGVQTARPFHLPALELSKTYYWRVDEINIDDPEKPWKGPVWRFTTADFVLIDDFESYSDADGNRIYQTWSDGYGWGWPSNGSRATAGNVVAPFAEQKIVHGGRQSLPFSYRNSEDPWYSETTRTWSTDQDWTGSTINTLSLWYKGAPVAFSENPPGTITMGAGGADIWGNFDQFRFGYKRLSGDGSITARVDSLVNTNAWAKAGVMIRQSLTATSAHADLIVSPGHSCSFQRRPTTTGATVSTDWTGGAVAAPYWVRLTRTGNLFKAETSADGTRWGPLGTSQTIMMTGDVYVGLCLTSHDPAAVTTAQFSNITTTGNVTGKWQAAEIGTTSVGNDSAPLYVVVEDSEGHLATVPHPENPYAVLKPDWTQWNIPLGSFTGVNLKAVRSMYLRVGTKEGAMPGGNGKLYFDDIGVIRTPPATGPQRSLGAPG